MRLLTILIILSTISGQVTAQGFTAELHQGTTTPLDARFEIVQSELLVKLTFRLDRFTGHVAQLVSTSNDNIAWEEMPILGLPQLQNPSRPRFQVFTSGLAARHTFLIDNVTGMSWQLATVKHRAQDGTEYEVTLWQPFAS